MIMNNQFNVNDYFTRNYNLGDKPRVSKFKLKLLHAAIVLASIVCIFVFPPVGIVAFLLFGFLFIGLPIIKIFKEKAAANEWQNNFDIRSRTWDAEFDKFYDARVAKLNAKKAAIMKLGLDLNPDIVNENDRSPEEFEKYPTAPFSIYGSRYDSYYRWGKDGRIRTDANEITWLFFSIDQIYIYTVRFNLTEDSKKKESTQEFFYSDIVSVSISTTSVEMNESKGFGGKETSVDTEQFKLVVPGDQMFFAFTSNDAVSASVKSMKDLIREKKKG